MSMRYVPRLLEKWTSMYNGDLMLAGGWVMSIGDPTYSSYYSGSVNLKKKKAKIKWKGGRGWPIKKLNCRQCEQIGRFIRLWASFKILWQQLICPNLSHSYAIFVNVSKSIIFQSEIIFGQLF